MRKAFGPKRDEVKGEWRKLHKEELHDMYSVRNLILPEGFREWGIEEGIWA